MKIARKIYYDLVTGNVIQEIGEREGSVRETTFEEDYQSYPSLSNFNPLNIGGIQLTFGQYREKFGVYAYHIDLVTKDVIFDPTPIQIEEQIIEDTLLEKFSKLQLENANTIATVDMILTEILPLMMG